MATILQQVYAEAAAGSASQTLTLSQAITAGSTVVVMTGFGRTGGTPDISSVVNNGTANTYTQVTGARGANTTNNPRMMTGVWYVDGANGSGTTVTVTFNLTSATVTFVGVIEFSNTIAPSVNYGAGASGTTTPAVAGTISVPGGQLLLSCIITADGTVNSVASPWTAVVGSVSYMSCYYDLPPAGTYGPTYTLSGNNRWASSTVGADLIAVTNNASNVLLKKVT